MGAQWKAKGKEIAANAKGRLFSRLAKDIMVAWIVTMPAAGLIGAMFTLLATATHLL